MRSAKSITLKKTKTLHCLWPAFLVLFSCAFLPAFSQDNSPYSRFGIGDLVPPTNVINRGLGGISAGYSDYLSINFNNPASYSAFEAGLEKKSKKLVTGRAILDVGMNFENRTLKDQAKTGKFTASNALFSYVQVGVPLRKNWGLSFGLRPISRISYKIIRNERLYNPLPPYGPIDSAITQFQGDGGAYLASIGTGFKVFQKEKKYNLMERLSLGVNAGYLFGRKDYTSRRTLINDTVQYEAANYETKTNFSGLYFTTGIQYQVPLNEEKRIMLNLGAFGNWSQTVNARRDQLRETFIYDENIGYARLDSVSDMKDVKGKVVMPSSYTFGFVVQKYTVPNKQGGWLFGADFEMQNWDQYRIYGQTDSVKNKWEFRAGAQFNPIPKRNYFSYVSYRFGFFAGSDYIKVGQKLPVMGGSFGLGLPLVNKGRQSNQFTVINLCFEYSKRGNNDNLLKENMFRLSLGFSLSDIWFIKRKYD
ncbi:MAG TPA: hypothetical protein PKC72_01275 [Chitinophagaceae bacterium]|nr:hypothetical protein [Chitinophagaceae bacterium]